MWRRTEPAQLVREYNTAGVGLRDAAAVSGVRRHITGAVPCVHTLWWLLLVRLAPLHTGGCRGSRGRRQEGGVRDGKRSTLFFSACGLADTAVRTLSGGLVARIRPTHTDRGIPSTRCVLGGPGSDGGAAEVGSASDRYVWSASTLPSRPRLLLTPAIALKLFRAGILLALSPIHGPSQGAPPWRLWRPHSPRRPRC